MDRKDKIEILAGIAEGKKSVSDLRPAKCYLLDCGVIKEFSNENEVTVNVFCKRFIPDKDIFILIVYTAHNLPAEYNFCDPSGEIMKQIIARIPELDTKDYRQFISDCQDLTKTEVWQKIQGDGV